MSTRVFLPPGWKIGIARFLIQRRTVLSGRPVALQNCSTDKNCVEGGKGPSMAVSYQFSKLGQKKNLASEQILEGVQIYIDLDDRVCGRFARSWTQHYPPSIHIPSGNAFLSGCDKPQVLTVDDRKRGRFAKECAVQWNVLTLCVPTELPDYFPEKGCDHFTPQADVEEEGSQGNSERFDVDKRPFLPIARWALTRAGKDFVFENVADSPRRQSGSCGDLVGSHFAPVTTLVTS